MPNLKIDRGLTPVKLEEEKEVEVIIPANLLYLLLSLAKQAPVKILFDTTGEIIKIENRKFIKFG